MSKMIVSRRELRLGSLYIDNNNPKIELNMLLVDNNNLVSTNTRALACIRLENKQEEEFSFMIEKHLVELALKEKKAVKFVLEPNSIDCIDDIGDLFISFKAPMQGGHYPYYKNIVDPFIESTPKVVLQFRDESQIAGLCASQKVMLDKKSLPAGLQENKYDFFDGRININNRDYPIMVSDLNGKERFIIMPITDSSLFYFGDETI